MAANSNAAIAATHECSSRAKFRRQCHLLYSPMRLSCTTAAMIMQPYRAANTDKGIVPSVSEVQLHRTRQSEQGCGRYLRACRSNANVVRCVHEQVTPYLSLPSASGVLW